ncbi:serine hydrolase domain-containing protein [Thalassotalea sp. ND16A]|uniref:serine hydrolase domain-containing protein n=1 Tax=Thalassotalea sp. ND16A TaxID=1535422 RepID=UPI00051DB59D|nr:serine hydrolase domain-containing protein [Thalassotalea sp. ND16A]KGK00079.1 D-stereospecific aminopeptidase [Thalassotalea sp. ND16A]
MRKLSLLILSTLLTFTAYAEIAETAAIDKVFSQWDHPGSPGASVGVIKDGELIFSGGYGMANLEYDIPNSSKSVFRIGSTSKQFTAASIILLVEKGKISLSDTLNQFFPDFPDYAKTITISHLLNHTSGIRDYLTLADLSGKRSDDYYTDDDIMHWLINQQQTNFNPGDEFLYSNSGYWLLGQIVEHVSGINMAEFAQREIFEPLAMNHTHFHNDHNQIVKNRASGYVPSGENQYEISMTTLDMIGDGGIFTSVEDIKKWDDAYYNNKVFSKKFWSMMTKRGQLNSGEVIDYASGLFLGEYKGLKMISHGGSFVGFRANLIRFPEQKFSVVVFANRGDANPTRMAFQVADIFLKNDYEENNSADKAKESVAVEIELNPAELENVLVLYWNDERSDSRKIYIKDNKLIFSLNENREFNLTAIGNNKFVATGVPFEMNVAFYSDEQSRNIMAVTINGDTPVLSVGYKPASYKRQELNKFEGSYFNNELNVSYVLKVEHEELKLFVNNRSYSPLTTVMNDLFVNNQVGAFKFERDSTGRITGFKLAAGRVKNLTFSRL